MPRINVEARWWNDRRRGKLALKLGSFLAADGAALNMWKLAQEYWIPRKQWIPLKAWRDAELPAALLEVGLADAAEGKILVRGIEEHTAWWFQRQSAGHESAAARAAKYGTSRPKKGPLNGVQAEESNTVHEQPSGVQADENDRRTSSSSSSSSSSFISSSSERRLNGDQGKPNGVRTSGVDKFASIGNIVKKIADRVNPTNAAHPGRPQMTYTQGALAMRLDPYEGVLRGAQVILDAEARVKELNRLGLIMDIFTQESSEPNRCIFRIEHFEPTEEEIRIEAQLFTREDFRWSKDYIRKQHDALLSDWRFLEPMRLQASSRADQINNHEAKLHFMKIKRHVGIFEVALAARELHRNGELHWTEGELSKGGPYRYLSAHLGALIARGIHHARIRLKRRKAIEEGKHRREAWRFNPFLRSFVESFPERANRRKAIDRLRALFQKYFLDLPRGHRDEIAIAAHCFAIAQELLHATPRVEEIAQVLPFPARKVSR